MTLYLLIHEQDTDAAWGADVQVFLNATEAQKAMNAAYQETADRWNFDDQESDEEHMRTCSDSEATIRDDTDVEHWRIEERDLDVQMAIEVQGGLIQNIYANAGIYPDVFDLDVSAFPDKGEVYGDNVFEKDGIRRDRTGDGEKTRCLCGKRGIFNRDGPAMGPQIIRQLERRASRRSASFFHALASPGRPRNGGGASGAYQPAEGRKP